MDFSGLIGKKVKCPKGDEYVECEVVGAYVDTSGFLFVLSGGFNSVPMLIVKTPEGRLEEFEVSEVTLVA